jgi:hypothetical protein
MTPRVRRLAVVAVVAAASLLVARSAGAGPASPGLLPGLLPGPDPLAGLTGGQLAAASFLVGDGLAPAEAVRQILAQPAQQRTADRLARTLGERMTGWYLHDGRLMVNVLDRPAAELAGAAGAVPHLVSRARASVDGVLAEVDRLAGQAPAGAAPVGSSWYVDPASGLVVVRVPAATDGPAGRAFGSALRRLPGVRVERVRGQVEPFGLYGGEQVVTSADEGCSLGFNAVDRAGRAAFVTAGHCAVGRPLFSRGQVRIGGTAAYRFPGADYAAVWVEHARYWQPQPAVTRYGGAPVAVRGASPAPVGAVVCKSGVTTGWSCGRVVAYGVTVQYEQGLVRGLVQASACTEPGDSGGPWLAGDQAQGVTSGGQSVDGMCMDSYGEPSVSFYQPIRPALAALGLRLRVSR